MAVTNHRLQRLERALGIAGKGAPCPRCRGLGMPAVTITRTAGTIGTLKGACPACGKASSVSAMVVPLAPGEDPASDPWDLI